MIIDAHAHVFPHLGGANGWGSISAHMAALDRTFGPTRSASELSASNFRIGKFGRFEWVVDGVVYYRQIMSPSLQDQTSSPEFMLAQMEHAGIDMAVLQNAKVYGKLNDYIAECVRKYPDRFVGLAQIDELEADKETEISKLRYAVKQLGLKGIYYEADRFLEVGSLGGFNDKRFDLFWREVSDLEIMVDWFFLSSGSTGMSAKIYMDEMRAFSTWAERFPDIPSIVVMGLWLFPFLTNGEVRFPKELMDIIKKPNVFTEIIYPITAGRLGWDYPFPQAHKLIKQQYEEFGAHKLIWGSDMPNVERHCTYRQSVSYLKDYCDFIGHEDMDLILGGNLARILKIPTTEVPRTLLAGRLVAMA